MTDIKISQLGSTTTLDNTDLIPVSKSLGGGNWESKSISGINLMHGLTAARTISVAQEGIRDASTIKDAVALAVAMSPIPSETDPVVIQVFPGSYYEDNPITIPEWVTIYSEGGQYSAGVIANNDGAIFISSGNNTLDGFTIMGWTVGGSIVLTNTSVVYQSVTSATGQIKNCILINCQTGILSNGGSVVANYITGLSFQRVFDKFLSCTGGGFLTATSCNITGIMTRPVSAYYSYDTDSELYLFSCIASNCVNGMYADNNGYIDALSNHYEDCDYSIHIGSSGSSHAKIMGAIIEDSNTYDLFVESATARVAYIGHLDSSKFSIVSGAQINVVADDENFGGGLITGKASLQGKVSIGTPGAITLGEDLQVNIGEGSAFVNDQYGNPIVEYWSYDASAPSGSKFTRFTNNAGTQLIGANDAIYVGCKYPFSAIRLDVDVAMVTGASYITTEYWNGSTWVDLTAGLPGGGVAAYRRSDFALRANNIFQNVETQFVECSTDLADNGDWDDDNNVLDEIPLWDANENFYAIRFRNNGALTSGMTFDSGMVKPCSFMFSTSGKQANFGVYRTNRSVYVDSKLLYPDPTNPPSYTNLQMSTNITFADLPVFAKANAVSKASTSFAIPYDLDTASPVTCYVDCAIVTTDPGKDVYTTMYVARVDPTNPPTIGSIPEVESDQITTITTNANSFVSIVQKIDVSQYAPGDLFFFAIARKATDPSDTFSGDLIIGDVTFNYKGKFV